MRSPRSRALGAVPCLYALCAAACSPAGPSEASGPLFDFVDVAPRAGIDVVVVSGDARRWYIVESNGSGAAWLDYDSDGDPDLFVANGSGLSYVDDGRRLERSGNASSRLYRNDGAGRFSDVSDRAGARRTDWTNGVATGDVDNDGDPDLYLACFGPDVLLLNDGGHFVDATAEAGLGDAAWGASAVFADVDNDGALDLFVANYVQFDLENPPAGGRRDVVEGVEIAWGPISENPHGYNPGAPNRFYLGDGKGGFREATAAAGLADASPSCSYAAVFSDVDRDGWQDLLVANDGQPSQLYMNRGDGTFEEQGLARGFALDGHGSATAAMGLAVEDVDFDGDMDCFRTNFDLEFNTLLLNDGKGVFSDRTAECGLAQPSLEMLGWAAAFFDAECDGDLDLLVANGHVMPQSAEIGMSGWRMPTQLFAAAPSAEPADSWPAYSDVTSRAGSGLAEPRAARGIALADFDDDGDVDALVTALDEAPRLLENRSRRAGRWIAVALEGTRSNRSAYGARVEVRAGGRTWVREMRSTQGLYSSHDVRLHFGLGPVEKIDELRVHWPSGLETVVPEPALDGFVSLREPAEDPR